MELWVDHVLGSLLMKAVQSGFVELQGLPHARNKQNWWTGEGTSLPQHTNSAQAYLSSFVTAVTPLRM
jgi:hypothetical protein